jgi:hypothetical protein
VQENVAILLGKLGAAADARRFRIGRLGAIENEVLLLALLTSERTGHYFAVPSIACSIASGGSFRSPRPLRDDGPKKASQIDERLPLGADAPHANSEWCELVCLGIKTGILDTQKNEKLEKL